MKQTESQDVTNVHHRKQNTLKNAVAQKHNNWKDIFEGKKSNIQSNTRKTVVVQ